MAASGSSSGPSPRTIARMAANIIFGDNPVLRRFVRDPRGTILGFLLGWVVSRILDIGETVIGGILSAGTLIGGYVFTLLDLIVYPLRLGAESTTALVGSVTAANTAVAQSFGPLAPAALIVMIGAEVFLVVVLIDFFVRAGVLGVLGSIPVVGIAFTTIGQLYFEARDSLLRFREVLFE